MDSFREEVRELQIGFKIRRIRQERRMTLQALADATGLSKPLLSQIENEQVIPPLATLLRIAKAFRVQLQSFFQEEGSSARCVLTKAGESRKMLRRPAEIETPATYTYHSLAHCKKNRCCGSIIRATCGAKPKNSASNSSTPSRSAARLM